MEEREKWPAWLYVSVIAGATLMGLGGVIALLKPGLLLGPGEAISSGVRVYAGYLVSRNVAMAAMLLVLLFLRARQMLIGMMFLTAVIQTLDAVLDVCEGRWPIVPGVILFAAIFFLGAQRLSRKRQTRAGTVREGIAGD